MVKAVLFDFDGTLSTLRAGWEEIMLPFMKEAITGKGISEGEEEKLGNEIIEYIDQSTGIQTIFQMQWLVETVKGKGWSPLVLDAWGYKAAYNRLLLLKVKERIDRLHIGDSKPEDFLIKGAVPFLNELKKRNIELYVASGTDHPDVVREAEVLGVTGYFKEIVGAPVQKVKCSKEKVLQDLMEQKQFSGSELVVIGDGKVEVSLARDRGAFAIGLASDELNREGVNPVKFKRLDSAGAHWITGDFTNLNEWLDRLGL